MTKRDQEDAMERISDKHGPRLDDELRAESQSVLRGAPVESRAQEGREKEGPGEDQPTPQSRPGAAGLFWQGQEMDQDEVEARSNLARHLEPGVFPAGREELLASARETHAPDGVLSLLARLPGEPTFENVQAVWLALGGDEEHRF
jgi:hypothetical protein